MDHPIRVYLSAGKWLSGAFGEAHAPHGMFSHELLQIVAFPLSSAPISHAIKAIVGMPPHDHQIRRRASNAHM
jgi:hypothetical protein